MRGATEACCPGAFDHLMEGFGPACGPGKSATAGRRDPQTRRRGRDAGQIEEENADDDHDDKDGRERRHRDAGEEALRRDRRHRLVVLRPGSHAEAAGCCARETTAPGISQELGYLASDLAGVPKEADLGLGCGAPLGHLKLEAGRDRAGPRLGRRLDVFLRRGRWGRGARDRRRHDARDAGARAGQRGEGRRVERRVPRRAGSRHCRSTTASVDAVTSNCVINLVPDKAAVFAEIARVLKPGGRSSSRTSCSTAPSRRRWTRTSSPTWAACPEPWTASSTSPAREARPRPSRGPEGRRLPRLARQVAPEEADAMLAGWGVTRDDLAGTVHSITWRAVRR